MERRSGGIVLRLICPLSLLLLALCGAARVAAGQESAVDKGRFDIMAGLYFGSESDISGPMVRVRYSAPVAAGVGGAAELHYRDDAPGGGRTQVVGLGVQVVLGSLPSRGNGVWMFAGGSLDAAFTAHTSSLQSPDIESGVYAAASAGIGLALEIAGARWISEGAVVTGPGGPLGMVSVGAQASQGRGTAVERGTFAVYASTLTGTGDRYQQDPDFRGYAVVYERFVERWEIAVRGTLGISFLEFVADGFPWSSSAVTPTLGVTLPVVGRDHGPVQLMLTSNVGVWVFTEPNTSVYPTGDLGMEGGMAIRGLGLTAGVSGVVGNGPAGSFAGIQLKLGLRLRL